MLHLNSRTPSRVLQRSIYSPRDKGNNTMDGNHSPAVSLPEDCELRENGGAPEK